MHTAFLADLFNGKVGEAQKLFGVGNACLQQIVCDGQFELLFKNPGKIEFIDKKLLRQLIQGDFFSVVLVKILLNILEILFPCGTAAFLLGIPALLHQKRQKRSQLFIDLHIPDIGSGRGDLTELAVQLLV